MPTTTAGARDDRPSTTWATGSTTSTRRSTAPSARSASARSWCTATSRFDVLHAGRRHRGHRSGVLRPHGGLRRLGPGRARARRGAHRPPRHRRGVRHPAPGAVGHVSWVVDDLAAESARLEALGCALIHTSSLGAVNVAWHDGGPLFPHPIEVHRAGPPILGMAGRLAALADGLGRHRPDAPDGHPAPATGGTHDDATARPQRRLGRRQRRDRAEGGAAGGGGRGRRGGAGPARRAATCPAGPTRPSPTTPGGSGSG